MPQGRYDPRLKSLLEQKYGKSLPDELFQSDNSELSGARDRYKERAQTGNDLAFMSNAASRMGQLGGQRSESMYDPATVKGISQGAGLDLGAAKEDYSDRDKVRKYVADKYLNPEKAPSADWTATGKRSKSGRMIMHNRRTNETKEGPELDRDRSKEFSNRPESDKTYIKGLSKQIVDRNAIAQSLDAEIGAFEKAAKKGDSDMAVTLGRNMLKILNSTEGQDAVGAEEAKRLASFLEYKMFNFTEPGKFWGRDLDQFLTQISQKSNNIKESVSGLKTQLKSVESGQGLPELKDYVPGEKPPADVRGLSAEEDEELRRLEAEIEGANGYRGR